jgi:Flp pilus assembly protein TadG
VTVTRKEQAGVRDIPGTGPGNRELRMRLPAGAGARGSARAGLAEGDDERGSLTLMLAVLFVALLAMAGLVVDGGAKLDEAEYAAAVAQEAARAGAGMVNQARAYSTGSFAIDRVQALDAAQQYLAVAGVHGTVRTVGADSIGVTVTITEPTKILSIIGISTITSTGSATASLVTGVTGAGT